MLLRRPRDLRYLQSYYSCCAGRHWKCLRHMKYRNNLKNLQTIASPENLKYSNSFVSLSFTKVHKQLHASKIFVHTRKQKHLRYINSAYDGRRRRRRQRQRQRRRIRRTDHIFKLGPSTGSPSNYCDEGLLVYNSN